VVRGLSPHEWSIIDLYEDEFYELATVEAATEAGEAVAVLGLPPPALDELGRRLVARGLRSGRARHVRRLVSVWRATEPTSPLT